MRLLYQNGLAMALMSSLVNCGTLILQTGINKLGTNIIVAHTAARKVFEIFSLPVSVFGASMATYCGQNYGAGNWNRIKKGNKFSILGGSFATFIACILLIIAMPVILKAFTKDTAVAAQTLEIIKVTFPFYFFYTVLECFSSNLRGFGKAFLPMIVTVVSFCGFRIVALLALMC